MELVRAVVCGGRHYRPTEAHGRWLLHELVEKGVMELAHGECSGVDAWAEELICSSNMTIKVYRFPAQWDLRKDAAGPERNLVMAYWLSQAPVRFCFPFPGGTGTGGMIRHARNYGATIVPAQKPRVTPWTI